MGRLRDNIMAGLRRVVRHRPGQTSVIVLSLALGISGVGAGVSTVDWLLYRPSDAMVDANRVVNVRVTDPLHPTDGAIALTFDQHRRLKQLDVGFVDQAAFYKNNAI